MFGLYSHYTGQLLRRHEIIPDSSLLHSRFQCRHATEARCVTTLKTAVQQTNRIGFLFTHNKDFGGAIFVTVQRWAVPNSKVKRRHIGQVLCRTLVQCFRFFVRFLVKLFVQFSFYSIFCPPFCPLFCPISFVQRMSLALESLTRYNNQIRMLCKFCTFVIFSGSKHLRSASDMFTSPGKKHQDLEDL